MNCMKRAFLYVTRKRGKSLVLFTILLIMATFVLTGLSIGKASKTAQQNMRHKLGGVFLLSVNYSDSNPYLITETNENGFILYSSQQIKPTTVSHIRQIPGVKFCDAGVESLAQFEQVTLFPGNIPVDEEFVHSTTVNGVWRSDENSLFTDKSLTLTEGRHITEKDNGAAIICKDLAERSGLKSGDTITTTNTKGKKIQVKIIGLFSPKETEGFGEQVTSYDKIQNRVFLDLNTVIAMEDGPAIQGFTDIKITVEDPEEIEQIMEQAKASPDLKPNAFTVTRDDEAYQSAEASLTQLDGLVTSLLLIIAVVSAIILSLILTLWAKSRIHETGVLLSLGVKKVDIIGQYLIEVLLIAVLAFGLSFFTSSLVGNSISDTLMKQSEQDLAKASVSSDISNDISAEQSQSSDSSSMESTDFIAAELEVTVDSTEILQLYLIGFLIITVSVIVSSTTVMRLKPREILSRMS